MSATVLYMSMSLDGFIAGPNETVDNGLGDGGMRLHDWIFAGADNFDDAVKRRKGANRQIWDEVMATGAIVAGRGTFDPAQGWGGALLVGVPFFFLCWFSASVWAAFWP